MPDPQQNWWETPAKTPPPPASGNWWDTPAPKTAEPAPDQKGVISQVWDWLNTPLAPSIAKKAHEYANTLNATAQGKDRIEDMAKGFMAGAMDSAGEMGAQFTSPAGLILAVAGAGEAKAAKMGLTNVARFLKAIGTTAQVTYGAQGAKQVAEGVEEGDVNKIVQGGASVGMSALPTLMRAREAAGATRTAPTDQTYASAAQTPVAPTEAAAGTTPAVPEAPPVATPKPGGVAQIAKAPMWWDTVPQEEAPAAPAAAPIAPEGLSPTSPENLQHTTAQAGQTTTPGIDPNALPAARPESIATPAPETIETPNPEGGAIPARTPIAAAPLPAAGAEAPPPAKPKNKAEKIAAAQADVDRLTEDHQTAEQAFSQGEANGWTDQKARRDAVDAAFKAESKLASARLNLKDLTRPPAPAFETLSDPEKAYLVMMRDELQEFPFVRGTSYDDLEHTHGDITVARDLAEEQQQRTGNLVQHTAGAPVFHDIRQGKNWTRTEVRDGITKYLEGGKPTVIADFALQAARHHLGLLPPDEAVGRNAPAKVWLAGSGAYGDFGPRNPEPVGDLLASGETQARLPGEAGAVRDQEVAHPQFAVPEEENFLKPPPSDEAAPVQRTLADRPGEDIIEQRRRELGAAQTEESFARKGLARAREGDQLATWQPTYEAAQEKLRTANMAHDRAIASVHGAPEMPPYLAGARPRYGYQSKNFELTFADPVDKALYIVANEKTLSPNDAGYLKYLEGVGLDESTAREAGKLVRDAVKEQAKNAKGGGTLAIPRIRPENLDMLMGGLGIVKPLIPKSIRRVAGELSGGVDPAGINESAARTAGLVREAKAQIANAATREQWRGAAFERFFNARSDAANVKNIATYERTGKFADAPEGYSEMYKRSTDSAHALLRKAYNLDGPPAQQSLPGYERAMVGYVENYVRRAFEFGSKDDADKATSVLLGQVKRSLSASKSPLKSRVLDVPLDQALKVMQDQGLKVKMATTNPETLRQWTMANAQQAWAYRQAWDSMKANGLIKFVGGVSGAGRPEGYVPLNDRVATVFFPSDQGMVMAGKYYADPAVAKILNRAISTGLGGSPTFRGIRTVANAMNQVQLGFSGFHLTGTIIRSMGSDVAAGVQQIIRGAKNFNPEDIGRGTVKLARGATVIGSFLHNYADGKALTEGLKRNAPEALEVLEQKLNPAGGRIQMDQAYANQGWKNARKAFANQEYVKTLGHGVLALFDAAAWPIMNRAVPYAKLGTFMDLASDIAHRMPEATGEQLKRAYGEAYDLVDNRYGQLNHDNLFWHRAASDLAHVAIRSVGWNLGTLRDLGGGLSDAVLKGKATDRAYYALTLPITVGYLGAIYQYLHTGKMPQSTKDYMNPQNGQVDQNGNPERISLPTELKDMYAASHHPIAMVGHKLGPLPLMASQIITNRDFRGDMLWNPDDPVGTQLEQAAMSVLKQLEPLSSQQFRRASAEDDTGTGGANAAAAKVEKFFGAIPAAREVVKTPAMAALDKQLEQRLGETHRTPEQVATDDLKTAARTEIRTGKFPQSLKALLEQGYFNNTTGDAVDYKNLGKFLEDSKKSPLERQLQLLPLKERLKVLQQLVAERQAQQGGQK